MTTPLLLSTWVGIELIYFAYIRFYWVPKLSPIKTSRQHPWFEDPLIQVDQAYQMMERLDPHYTFSEFIVRFFRNAPIRSISADDLKSFLAWAVYQQKYKNLTDGQTNEMEGLFQSTVDRFCISWEGGNNEACHIQGDLEPLSYVHLPLLYYGGIQVVEKGVDAYLYWKGFRKYCLDHTLSYWIRDAEYKEAEYKEAPIILFHGICTGWSGFMPFVEQVSTKRTIILFNYDCVKRHSMSFYVPTATNVAEGVELISKRHELPPVSLIGVSWGTFLVGWVARLKPHLVSHITLLDPVAMTVFLPETIYSLLYDPDHWLLHYFVRRDLTIANTLCRNFAWYNMALQVNKLEGHIGVTIGISMEDEFINTHAAIQLATRIQNEKRTNRVFIWDGVTHGNSIQTKHCIRDILSP